VAAPVPTAVAPPRRRFRQVLVVVLAVVGLLCLGGGATAFLYYDQATRPDLATPSVVTREYIRAYLIDRNDGKASEFVCKSTSGLNDVRALRDDLDKRAKENNLTIYVSIESSIEKSRSGDQANVIAEITLMSASEGTRLRRLETWSFDLKNDDGWRVCTAHEVTQ
jgi:hypothetical protein